MQGTGDIREDHAHREMLQRAAELRRNLVGEEFSSVTDDCVVRVCVLGEIVSGHGFPDDNIYVEYEVGQRG